jgi:hypothetical protein
MKNTKLAAAKLRMAMSGLKAAYQDASAEDRKVIVATMKEVQAVHGQLVNAEDEAVEDEEDVEGMEAEDLDADDGESADDLEMDEMAEEDAAAGMDMDDAHMSEDDMMDEEMDAEILDSDDDSMAPLSMDDMGMSDASEDEDLSMEVDGLDIPQEFVGDLGDLGLIEMDETIEDDGDEMSAEDEELAVAALALAANALKMLKAESEDELLVQFGPEDMPEEDEPESSQEEDESKEGAEHKAMKRGDQLHASRRPVPKAQPKVAAKTGDNDVVRKLREISARLSTVKTPAKPTAPVAASAQKRGMREVLGGPLARRAPTRAR